MIGKLRGLVDTLDDDAIILDVGGVGYHVFCASRTLAALPPIGEAAQLVIETHVREDHIHLYGFPDSIERDWFRLLLTVQGVGNKIALAILGAYAPEQLAHSILARDTAVLRTISGIGPRLAERIVTELKDKVTKLPTRGFGIQDSGAGGKKPETRSVKPEASATEDAISALVNLGYTRSEAYGATLKASQNAGSKATLDQLIKLSLKELVRG